MTAWWKKKTPQETSLLLAPLFPAPPAMRVEKSGQFTTLLAPVLDILSSHPLVDVDFGALEKTHEKDVLARNENASPRVTADEIVMTTFLNHAKMLNDHVDSSIFRPFIVAADTTNNNNNNNYDDDDTSLSFCIDMLNEIVVHDIDIVFSSVSLDDALMPPTTTTTTPTIQSPTIEFPTIDSSIPIHWLAVSCITNDNNTALAVAQLVDLLDVGIAFDASPISLTVVDSLLQFDAAVTSTTTISLAFQAVAVLQHNAMPAMAHSVARLDSTPFESLRSSLIVSLPPKSLDLTRRSPPAPARSTEERELQSHESRALPLLPIDHSPLMSVAFGDVLPPPPSLDTWNFDGAEADVLRAALLSSCRDVALRQNELPALESFVWPEPTLRFASVDVQSAVGALIDGAATWMATLPPEQAVLVDRKYRPLSVAVQNANGALVALDSVRDKRPRASLVGLVSLPATRTTQAPVPLALRRYAPAVFHCASSVSDDLSAFLRLQRGGVGACSGRQRHAHAARARSGSVWRVAVAPRRCGDALRPCMAAGAGCRLRQQHRLPSAAAPAARVAVAPCRHSARSLVRLSLVRATAALLQRSWSSRTRRRAPHRSVWRCSPTRATPPLCTPI
jgi:hypothetical protein